MCFFDTNRSHPIDGTVWRNTGGGKFKPFGKNLVAKYADVF